MAIVKRGNVWQVQVRVGKDPRTGRWLRRAATCSNETEARRVERALLSEAEANKVSWVEPTRLDLAAYLEDWLKRKEAEGRKPKTLHDYRRMVQQEIIPTLGSTALRDLSPSAIQRWQDTLAPSAQSHRATTAALAYRVLRSALSDAARLGLVAANPALRARPALRSPRKRQGFTLAEAQAILNAAQGERLAPLFAFLLHAGLRLGEALALRWSDVDMEGGIIVVRANRVLVGGRMVEGTPKSRLGSRRFALPGPALAALREQRALQAQEAGSDMAPSWSREGWVFSTSSGGALQSNNVDRAFRRVRARAGVPALPLHSLRHATASVLLAAGVPVPVAAKMLGHSVAMFTETYADLLVEATKDAAQRVDSFWAGQAAVREGARASGGEPTPPGMSAHVSAKTTGAS